jgi:hypothetical protein
MNSHAPDQQPSPSKVELLAPTGVERSYLLECAAWHESMMAFLSFAEMDESTGGDDFLNAAKRHELWAKAIRENIALMDSESRWADHYFRQWQAIQQSNK